MKRAFIAGFWLVTAAAWVGGAEKVQAPFMATVENKIPAPKVKPAGMVWIPGGEFSMGSDERTDGLCGGVDILPDARPVHRVYVDGFWMDATEVTNAEFARFVNATRYVTVAERRPRAEDFPGAPPELLVPGSLVFSPPKYAVPLDDPLAWWRYVPGANWQHPEGPGSDLRGRENHPVVQVAYEDAAAYAAWAGKRLPTEAEWEFASRGGHAGQRYLWGDELTRQGRWQANVWQGDFPQHNTQADGFSSTAPVASFASNSYGLFDMAGNVWEWCSDWYRPDTYKTEAGVVTRNPAGPPANESYDPQEPGVTKRVQRGGSFLCSDQYCSRYLPGARGKGAPDTGSNHVGFRCVRFP
jgi:formylglycine-generating enzyme required for sulfatase activity